MGESIGHISIHEAMTNTWYHISILIYSIMKKFLNIIFLDSLHKNKKSLFMDSEVYITKKQSLANTIHIFDAAIATCKNHLFTSDSRQIFLIDSSC